MEAVALAEPPASSPVEQKVRAVLSAMTEAVRAILDTEEHDRFARASHLCKLSQTLAIELVKTVKQAAQVRACRNEDMALGGYLGPEAQFVAGAQIGGEYLGYGGDMVGNAVMPRNMMPADTTTMQRDLMMMLQSWFEDQKKQKAADEAPPALSRYDHYLELNEALSARDKLKAALPESPMLTKINQDIERLVDLVAQGTPDDPKPADVVPPELLRRHSPGADLEPGNPFDPRGPVLHREDRDARADRGGEAGGDHQEALG
jgi:hypothetical protein